MYNDAVDQMQNRRVVRKNGIGSDIAPAILGDG